MKTINERLKKFRFDNRFSQSQMAELMNITTSQYSKIENGKSYFNLHHIEAMSANLGKDFTEVYGIINDVRDEQLSPDFVYDNLTKSTEPFPHFAVPFELALQRLKVFCIDNNYLTSIHPNGDISLEIKSVG